MLIQKFQQPSSVLSTFNPLLTALYIFPVFVDTRLMVLLALLLFQKLHPKFHSLKQQAFIISQHLWLRNLGATYLDTLM